MIGTLTSAVIVMAGCLVGLALLYSTILSDQNKRIARIKKDTDAMEQAQRSNYSRLGILEKEVDRAVQDIDLKEENTQLKESRDWDYEYIVKVNEENKRLKREKEEFQRKLTAQLEVNTELRMSNKDKHNLLSEFSEHIGNKPSSSTYKYFRGKLDGIGIKEGE